MEINEALELFVKDGNIDIVLDSRKARACLLDYRVDEPSISSYMSLIKTNDFILIIKNYNTIVDWNKTVKQLSIDTKLQPSFIKDIIQILTGVSIATSFVMDVTNCRVDGTFEDEDIYYTGQLVNGKPDGCGTIIFKEGTKLYNEGYRKYVGESHCIDDKVLFMGFGTFTSQYGSIRGMFDQGRPEGEMEIDYSQPGLLGFKGKAELPGGNYSELTNNGRGHYDLYGIRSIGGIDTGEMVFDGEMINGMMNGVISFVNKDLEGCHVRMDGGKYSLFYKETETGSRIEADSLPVTNNHKMSGKVNGKCIIYYKNGDIYRGNVENDLRSGNGTYYSGGIRIESQWRHNNPFGSVKLHSNGTEYIGSISNDVFNGKENKIFGKKTTIHLTIQS